MRVDDGVVRQARVDDLHPLRGVQVAQDVLRQPTVALDVEDGPRPDPGHADHVGRVVQGIHVPVVDSEQAVNWLVEIGGCHPLCFRHGTLLEQARLNRH